MSRPDDAGGRPLEPAPGPLASGRWARAVVVGAVAVVVVVGGIALAAFLAQAGPDGATDGVAGGPAGTHPTGPAGVGPSAPAADAVTAPTDSDPADLDYALCGYPVEALGWEAGGERSLWAVEPPVATADATISVGTVVTPGDRVSGVAETVAFVALDPTTWEVVGVAPGSQTAGGDGRRDAADGASQRSVVELYSCADPDGRTHLAPGVYTLLASQTVYVAPRLDGPGEATLATGRWQVRIGQPDGDDPDDPLSCGTTLVTTSQPDVAPQLMTLAHGPQELRSGDAAAVTVTLLNATEQAVRGRVEPGVPDVVVARDGVVVGGTRGDTRGRSVDVPAGGSVDLPATVAAVSCGSVGLPARGRPLPAGTYEMWVAMALVGDDGSVTPRVDGPWPLVVTE